MQIRDDILEAAVDVFTRFGLRKATVGDIAERAGVSRQTVYARFADKDAIIAATIEFLGSRCLDQTRKAWEDQHSLAAKLDAYLRHCVIDLYRIAHGSAGGWDMVIGTQPQAREAIRFLLMKRAKALETILSPHAKALAKHGQCPIDLAMFISTVGDSLKHTAEDEVALKRSLDTLRASVLLLSGVSPSRGG
ncbi:TetR/AcrR family transcriptional regulator [Paracoccus aurantiacus]|uniref:TetR/AcrR family transcriptional regulator n=1 Tax=Paracoccus aurantiacus TaxID=2599412 RepID=A0A5C6S3M5_9RHOB|nr:TetR/AcrR family transcriptional regulator [Paracoccus aurantiacus]TXB69023.1 TetR/AcrR family transcriptional regulator [Paracoccus aurantiacus]